MSVLAIVDELAALFEPNQSKRDGSAARPLDFVPEVLYLWPTNERFATEGDGSLDEEWFSLRVAWGTDAGFEVNAGERTRATTDVLVAKADALAALIRSHRAGASYEYAEVSRVDYESLVTPKVRGFYLDISGRQLRS